MRRFAFFRLHARDASGNRVVLEKARQVYDLGAGKIEIVGLAEVGPPTGGVPGPAYYLEDHDNYFDLKGAASLLWLAGLGLIWWRRRTLAA